MAMSSCSCSLPLSPLPGTFDPGSLAKTGSEVSFVTRNNVDESGNTSKKSSSIGPNPNLLSTTTGRREAIGVMGLGLVELITWQFQWQPRIAEAAETAPCELTVAPSGLAYCDKVVGTGPEAVKGQFIKVTSLMTWFRSFSFLGSFGVKNMSRDKESNCRHIMWGNWRTGRCSTAATVAASLSLSKSGLARYSSSFSSPSWAQWGSDSQFRIT